jgi:hypothetical protein
MLGGGDGEALAQFSFFHFSHEVSGFAPLCILYHDRYITGPEAIGSPNHQLKPSNLSQNPPFLFVS